MYRKKTMFLLLLFFLFFYILNYLTPMAFGDDYVYSFIWQGHSEYEPMTNPAVRVSSFDDLRTSLWSHYFTWSGRTVSHFLIQFFLWLGKNVFDFFNSLVALLLVVEIYWCTNKGVVTLDFEPGRLCWIFFALWFFTPGFSPVFFWLTGACNYLWTAVLLLAFLLPYIHKYYVYGEIFTVNRSFRFIMFFLGVIAGWSNENSICWIILALIIFIFANRKRNCTESWMIVGLIGLIIGYLLLMFAPGNVARLIAETGTSTGWITSGLLKANFRMLGAAFCFQFLLWYFCFRSIFILFKKAFRNEGMKQEVKFVQILCMLSFFMTTTMLLSPNFPLRSSFPGTVPLIIASSVLLRIQEEYVTEVIRVKAKRFLCIVAILYFMTSATASLYGFYNYHMQVQKILTLVIHSAKTKEETLIVPALEPVSETIVNISGLHLLFYEMSEDANDWRNVAFARYYGIKGIRMVKKE